MKPKNPYKDRSGAEVLPFTERGSIEAARHRVVKGANSMRYGLWAYDPSVAAPAPQIEQTAQYPESPAPNTPHVGELADKEVPESIKVVSMMGRDDQRQLSEREQLIADAQEAAAKAYDYGIAA